MALVLKALLTALLVVVVIPAAVLAVLISYADDSCGNTIHAVHLSPDQSQQAVVFERSCGATTGFSTQVSVINSQQALPNNKGNIYIIAGHPQQVAPDIAWLADDKLLIKRPLTGAEFKAATHFGWRHPIEVVYGTQ